MQLAATRNKALRLDSDTFDVQSIRLPASSPCLMALSHLAQGARRRLQTAIQDRDSVLRLFSSLYRSQAQLSSMGKTSSVLTCFVKVSITLGQDAVQQARAHLATFSQ